VLGEKKALFASVKTLTHVCYLGHEATDRQLQRLLRELPGAGVCLIDLDVAGAHITQPYSTLLLAGSAEALAHRGEGMAVVGYGRLAQPCSKEEREAAGQADILVEGFDEVDEEFLDRIMKRAQGLPWTTVVTSRCFLREITLDDLDDLYELYAQPGITDYTEPLYERSEEEQYTRDYIRCMYRFYGYGMWLVFERDTGKLMGRAGFSHQDLGDETVLEMGYIIGVPWQRQGYATEVCLKLLEFARSNLSDFGTLNCFVEPGNTASHGLMKKLGFAAVGRVVLCGKEMIRYVISLVPTAYK
jgi:RimJ/RimL family protein N-acetyltransferase